MGILIEILISLIGNYNLSQPVLRLFSNITHVCKLYLLKETRFFILSIYAQNWFELMDFHLVNQHWCYKVGSVCYFSRLLYVHTWPSEIKVQHIAHWNTKHSNTNRTWEKCNILCYREIDLKTFTSILNSLYLCVLQRYSQLTSTDNWF